MSAWEGMKPSQVAASLRQIADKIERSQRPSIKLVNRDLRKVVAAMFRKAYGDQATPVYLQFPKGTQGLPVVQSAGIGELVEAEPYGDPGVNAVIAYLELPADFQGSAAEFLIEAGYMDPGKPLSVAQVFDTEEGLQQMAGDI